ncbi:MAG: zinc-ribbon domain-containing protein [Paludibacter sp.]|nr:zinc-ribbon domain-containing protein [Paludibacter sp.]
MGLLFGKKPETKSDEFDKKSTKLSDSVIKTINLINSGYNDAAFKEYSKACKYYDECADLWSDVVDEYLCADEDYTEIDKWLVIIKQIFEAFYTLTTSFEIDLTDNRDTNLSKLERIRGEILVRAGKNHLAIKTLLDALEYDNPDEESLIYRFLGDAYNNVDKYEEALDAYTESLESDWNCAEVWCGKASALLDLHRFDEGLEAAFTARDLSEIGSTNYLTSMLSIDLAYYGLGELDKLLDNVVPNTNVDVVDGCLWYLHYLILKSAGVTTFELTNAHDKAMKLCPDIEVNNEIQESIREFKIELQKTPFGIGKKPSQKSESEQTKPESSHDLPNALIWYAKYLRLKNDDAPESNYLEAYNTALKYYPGIENRKEAQDLRTEIFAANTRKQPQKPVESNIHYHVTGSFFAGNVGVLAKDDAVVNRANIGEGITEKTKDIFCPDCGRKLPPDARFCMGCGKPLK